MTRNILLTPLDAQVDDGAPRYYRVQNDHDCDHCEAWQSMEASTECILARFPIDEILIIGDGDCHEGAVLLPFRARWAPEPVSKDPASPCALDLYRLRLAYHIDESGPEQGGC